MAIKKAAPQAAPSVNGGVVGAGPGAGAVMSPKLSDFISGGFGIPAGYFLLKSHDVDIMTYGQTGITTLALNVTASEVKFLPGGKFELAGGGDIVSQYSIGPLDKYAATAGKKGIVSLGSATGLSKSSNIYIYLEHFVKSGFDEASYDAAMPEWLGALDGHIVEIEQIPEPERNIQDNKPAGGATGVQQQNKPRSPRTISVVKWIFAEPGDKVITNPKPGVGAAPVHATSAPAPAAAPAVNGSAAAVATNGAAVEGSHEEVLSNLLNKVIGGQASVPRVQTRVAVYRELNGKVDNATRDAIIALYNDDTAIGNALAGVGGGYIVEGANIKAL